MIIGNRSYPLLFFRLPLFRWLSEPKSNQSQIRQFAGARQSVEWLGSPGLQVFLYAIPLSGETEAG